MSNIGKKPVELKDGATVNVADKRISVSGPKGNLEMSVSEGISVVTEDGLVRVKKEKEGKQYESSYGLVRALLANMVEGVTKGFEKKLELVGVGFRARVEGDTLVLNVGFANPVRIKAPEGISLKVEDNNVIVVSGIDKQLVGNTASIIREVKVPDPYKAKGIKYAGERIRRKVGKTAKAVGGK